MLAELTAARLEPHKKPLYRLCAEQNSFSSLTRLCPLNFGWPAKVGSS